MSILSVEAFTEESLPLVQEFDCGDEAWSQQLANWIKSESGALRSIDERGNRVWLYHHQDALVGFGSLGENTWSSENEEGQVDVRTIAYLPMMAIDKRFRGGPADRPRGERYSSQILRHLIAEARELPHPEVGLMVDERNSAAIKLYERFGFQQVGRKQTPRFVLLKMLKVL